MKNSVFRRELSKGTTIHPKIYVYLLFLCFKIKVLRVFFGGFFFAKIIVVLSTQYNFEMGVVCCFFFKFFFSEIKGRVCMCIHIFFKFYFNTFKINVHFYFENVHFFFKNNLNKLILWLSQQTVVQAVQKIYATNNCKITASSLIYVYNWPLQPFSQDYWPSLSHHLCCVC